MDPHNRPKLAQVHTCPPTSPKTPTGPSAANPDSAPGPSRSPKSVRFALDDWAPTHNHLAGDGARSNSPAPAEPAAEDMLSSYLPFHYPKNTNEAVGLVASWFDSPVPYTQHFISGKIPITHDNLRGAQSRWQTPSLISLSDSRVVAHGVNVARLVSELREALVENLKLLVVDMKLVSQPVQSVKDGKRKAGETEPAKRAAGLTPVALIEESWTCTIEWQKKNSWLLWGNADTYEVTTTYSAYGIVTDTKDPGVPVAYPTAFAVVVGNPAKMLTRDTTPTVL